MIISVIKHAIMITSFVLMMMLLIEYINVQTRGAWQESLKKSRFGQYFLAAFLGVVPGCLGAFTVVSLYSHRMVSFGALVTVMIATSGDEAFVMLSMFPVEAIWLSVILFLVALIAGFGVDLVFKDQNRFLVNVKHEFEIHEKEHCRCFSRRDIVRQLKQITFPRAFLVTLFTVFLLAVFFGELGPEAWNWKKITFTLGSLVSLFIITTVPDHFLEEHLYAHVIKKHLLRVFLWTLGALLVVQYIDTHLDVTAWLQENSAAMLVSAAAIGIIPESGPHMVFVTMYAKGLIPFAVLLASSISQDGHGTLPLLAVSTKAFIWLKVVNIAVALVVGMIFLLLFG
ncbi:MAG: putative manganese transporter [Campylobacterota bacterium]|nr:putative manganese transporter [Campylobacterota bacterium]